MKNRKDCRVVILAAGQGTRLHPLTKTIPKCMVRLNGKPLITKQIEILNSVGLEDITVVGGYLYKKIQSEHSFKLVVNEDFEFTNMVESLFCAEDYIQEDCDLVISYGDIVYEKTVIEKLLNSHDSINVVVDTNWKEYWLCRMCNPLDDAESLVIDGLGKIVEIGKKTNNYTNISAQYIGLIKICRTSINCLKTFYYGLDRNSQYDGQSFRKMYMTSFIQLLIENGWDVVPTYVNNGWLEVDTQEDMVVYESMAVDHKLKKYYNHEN